YLLEKVARAYGHPLYLASAQRRGGRKSLSRTRRQPELRARGRERARGRGRYGAGARAHRNRRKIQRNPRDAAVVARVGPGRPHRHRRRDPLSKKTFEAAAAAHMHLIVQLKENQPNLCQKAEALRADAKPLSSVQTVDAKRRNRHETRTIA